VLSDHGLGRAEVDRRVDAVLEQTSLSEFRTAFPKQLSGGMRQRVGIARALAVSPAVLLMDEPLSALDAQTRSILMEEFVDLFQRTGITCIYVTHNLNEAVRLADRVIVLSRRPGEIKDVIEIPVPLTQRQEEGHGLSAIHDRMWQMIRHEAIQADKELANA